MNQMNLNENKGRILIVDDEEIVHKTLKRILGDGGYTIDSAYGGEQALSMLENDYDLIICDIRMPDIDGIEVLRQVKKRELPVEVIMLTGYATIESATRALNYGARDYIMKPIDIPEFRSKVGEAVDIAQLAHRNMQFYNAIVSGKVSSLMIDGRSYPIHTVCKENREIIRRLLEVIHDGIVVLDVHGSITFANVNFAQKIGETYPNILGKQFESYILEGERGRVVEVITRLSRGEVAANIQAHLKTCFGRTLCVSISSTPIYHEMEYRGIALVISDITEMNSIRKKVNLLANLVENAQCDMMLIIRFDGQIMECNALVKDTFGYTMSEMLSQNIRFLFKPEADWKKIRDSAERKSHCRSELLAISRDGREFPVEMTVSRYFSKVNKCVSIICFMRDITDRKKAEESLKKALKELKATQVQLLQAGKLSAMGEMAAGVAHELTQPLLGIKGFTTSLLEDLKSGEKETFPAKQALSDLEVILQQTDRMTSIINAVRNFAHETKTEKAWIYISKPIEDALMLFSEQLRVHNIAVEKNLAEGLPKVWGNANQLQQVFINLITNARDAMDAKGGKGQLTITTGVVNSYVYIEVKDTGIGADKETVSRMFEPFFSTKNAGQGIGLGLSIAKRIIDDHKGKIMVECKPGVGCKFTIRLPSGGKDING